MIELSSPVEQRLLESEAESAALREYLESIYLCFEGDCTHAASKECRDHITTSIWTAIHGNNGVDFLERVRNLKKLMHRAVKEIAHPAIKQELELGLVDLGDIQ